MSTHRHHQHSHPKRSAPTDAHPHVHGHFVQKRSKASLIAIGITLFLTALKMGVAILSGSVSVLSEALHSMLDLLSASVAFFAIRLSGKPADEDHPFGHGKIETFSSVLESFLLLVTSGFIVHEAYQQWINPSPIQHDGLAIVIMVISLLLSYFAYHNNSKIGEETDSPAIKANALHFLADVVASIGVLVGLILIKLTGVIQIDACVAFAVAAYIAWISFGQLSQSFQELLDRQLPEDEVQLIKQTVEKFKGRWLEFHDLRTRKSGPVRHMDFHLILCGLASVNESHRLCDEIEAELKKQFHYVSVHIHVEPCSQAHRDTKHCTEFCEWKQPT
jgi:cation diffusion facilitator family transporter